MPLPVPTKTSVTFLVKNEPVLEMIHNEFKRLDFYSIVVHKKGRYKVVLLVVNKVLKVIENDFIKLDGELTQFEHINFY